MWLFPDAVAQVSRWLPFQYTFQAPLEIYIGRIPAVEAGHVLAVQAGWVVVLFVAVGLVWDRAQRRLFVQGG